MAKLPILSGRQARRAFEKAGQVFDRQRGSHMILRKPDSAGMLSIPDHREPDTGRLRGLIPDSGLTVDRFLSML